MDGSWYINESYIRTDSMIVVFFYKINGQRYYGKYIGYVSDGYEYGLDIEIRSIFYPIWKNVYSLSSEEEVCVGIVSDRREGSDYYSEQERNVFDTIYCNWTMEPPEIYVNGLTYKSI